MELSLVAHRQPRKMTSFPGASAGRGIRESLVLFSWGLCPRLRMLMVVSSGQPRANPRCERLFPISGSTQCLRHLPVSHKKRPIYARERLFSPPPLHRIVSPNWRERTPKSQCIKDAISKSCSSPHNLRIFENIRRTVS